MKICIIQEELLIDARNGMNEYLVPLSLEIDVGISESKPISIMKVVAVYERISGLNKNGMALFAYRGVRVTQ